MIYTSWRYRARIGVVNPTSISDYQINVIVPYRVHMKSDFSDIRFSDNSGNELSYWIESYTSFVSANVWIKCPSNCNIFYLYYGNSIIGDASSGTNTFEFFDDFSTDTWTKSDASVTVTDNQLHIAADGGNDDYAQKTVNITLPVIYESRHKSAGASEYTYSNDNLYSGATRLMGVSRDDSNNWYLFEGAGNTYSVLAKGAANTWIDKQFIITSTVGTGKVKLTTESTYTQAVTRTWLGSYSTITKIALYQAYDDVCDWDNIRIRKYTAIEPTATVFETNINPFHRRRNSQSITIYTKLYSIDSLFKKLNIDKNYNLDALIKALNIDRNYVVDTLFKKLNINNNYSIDLLISNLGIDKNYVIDILFKKLNIDKNYNLDALIKLLDIDKNYVIDLILKAIINETYSVDALIKLLDINTNYVVDGIIVRIVTFKPTASGRQIKPTASGRQIKPTASGREQ